MLPLSLTGRRWLLPKTDHDTDSLVHTLLAGRGITALGEGELLEEFGHDARLLRDFEKAAARIVQAVRLKEPVTIFGDYDCDGITGAALLVRFFRRRGIQPRTRLPNRLKEGYGLKTTMVEEFAAQGTQLLITVDTGITAGGALQRARELGVDVIVIDHHRLPDVLPIAAALLHPSLCEKSMLSPPCGAGLAWALVRALEKQDGNDEWDDCETDIALAAIGTVADVVELRGGNRTLVHRGLLALHQIKEGPLKFLALQSGLTPPFTARDIGFRIAPRINAAGRMADPHLALSALLGNQQALLQLQSLNVERQDLVSDLLDDLMPRAESQASPLLCFADRVYSPGICGLLAGRLCERFGRPSIVAGVSDGVCSASLRSIAAYDVTAALARCSDLLLSFGGHAMAAGCTFKEEVFPVLTERLAADLLERVQREDLIPAITADAVLDIRALSTELCERLRALEPYGQGNPEPRFIIRNVSLRGARCVGRESKHLQAHVHGSKLIGFGLGHLLEHSINNLDLLCRIGIDTWQGARNPQLFLDDMRVAEVPGCRSQGVIKNQRQGSRRPATSVL